MLGSKLSLIGSALALLCAPAAARPPPTSEQAASKSQPRQATAPSPKPCTVATFDRTKIQAAGPAGVSNVRVGVFPAPWSQADLSEFSTCIVAADFKTDGGNTVVFQVYMPNARADGSPAWNGRFMTLGNGGFNGIVPSQEMFFHLAQGYAVAGTDTGHSSLDVGQTGNVDYSWAKNAPEKQTDWAYRAMDYMVPMAKKTVELYYAVEPKTYSSIYLGCSTGGRQGLKHLERSPDHFDGYIIGAPADNRNLMPWVSYLQTQVIESSPDGTNWLSGDLAFSVIRPEVYRICTTNGAGLITDPDACTATMLEPDSWSDILCTPTRPAQCITETQRDVLIKFMQGVKVPEGLEGAGTTMNEGFDAPSVGGWSVYPSFLNQYADQTEFPTMFLGQNITWSTADGGRQYTDAVFKWDTAVNVSPHLGSVANLGAKKIIMYTGKRDNILASLHTRAIAAGMRSKTTNFRYYEVPGMDHCFNTNGDGTVLGTDGADPAWWIGAGGMNAVKDMTLTPNLQPKWIHIPSSNTIVGNTKTDVVEAMAQWITDAAVPGTLTANGFQKGSIFSGQYIVDPSKVIDVPPFF